MLFSPAPRRLPGPQHRRIQARRAVVGEILRLPMDRVDAGH
ncbi:hypothetical protein [Streptomyces sp. MB09-02B]|nr:hypothetical protein [Streptomyces sp. MB09-02B]